MSEMDETQRGPARPDESTQPREAAPDVSRPVEDQPEHVYGPTSIPLPNAPVTPTSAPKAPPAQPPHGEGQFAQQSVAPSTVTRPAGGAAPPRPTAPVRGRVETIHYELSYIVQNADRGPRGAIVLLHDLPGGAFVWRNVMPALAATGRAIYAFDMLGYGESDHPWPSDTTVWGHADNLSPAFRALNLTDVVLVGFGVGGGVAQVLATRLYREELAALALLDTYAYNYAYAADWPLTQMEQRHDPDAPRHMTTEQLLTELRATLPKGSAKPGYLAGSALEAYIAEWNSDLGREMFFQHVRQMLPNYVLSVASDLKQLQIPTLVVWGEQDQVTPLTLGRRLARDIPGARLAVVPGAGHLVLDDAADQVGPLLADFVRDLKR